MPKRLGKGLDALFPQIEIDENDQVVQLKLSELRPNPYQPRKTFNPESIAELCQSIKEHGVIQPIIVRKGLKGYDIVAGERRFRASIEAGLETIPAVVKTFSENQMMEIALIENLQREDLNAMETATAYKRLMDTFNLTQDELAIKVGKSRPHVANFLRLLQLPSRVQNYVSDGELSMGHARALLGLKDKNEMERLAKKCVQEQLSVRQLEELIKKINSNVPRGTMEKRPTKRPAKHIIRYEEQLKSKLGTAVKIKVGQRKGKIEIEFFSDEDLQRLVDLIS
jgi:ParB family chromosome partitioning protein